MPDPTQVSILKRDGFQSTFYETYEDASDVAEEGDVIIIWADLTEQIILKNKVDIWLIPGVIINLNNTSPTIKDNNQAVECNIYGQGIIKNSGGGYCINITNVNTKLAMECDYIENTYTNAQTTAIYVSACKKFHLNCNKVISGGNGLWLGSSDTNIVEDLNLRISKIETGNTGTSYTGTSLFTNANGIVNIDEILCKKLGHCFRHSAGTITANVKRIKSTHNDNISSVHVDQGSSGTQKLTLYFDEIINLHSIAIQHHQGTGSFIGRYVYSENASAIDLSGNNLKGYIRCNKIVSKNLYGLRSFENNQEILISSDYIEGHAQFGCVYFQGDANIQLKNAKLVNNSSSQSRCVVLEPNNNNTPNLTLNNLKIVAGDTVSGSIIFLAGFEGISIKNYGLYANKELDPDEKITLLIGDDENYLFVESEYLT